MYPLFFRNLYIHFEVSAANEYLYALVGTKRDEKEDVGKVPNMVVWAAFFDGENDLARKLARASSAMQ